MNIELNYGKTIQNVIIPDENLMGILKPNNIQHALIGEAEVRRALDNPIGTKPLCDCVSKGSKVAIVTSDITRPCPTAVILPPLISELEAAGVELAAITVTFALGSHRGQTEEERKKLLGEYYGKLNCRDHNPDDTVHLGVTSRGTPVDIDRIVAAADFVICLGNIEYHYFAGYSGGAKAIMPGVSTRDAIQANHSRMISEDACAGRLEGNPVREDIEEAAAMLGIDYIVNVVLDEHKQIVKAVAGDPVEAHRAGCAFLDTMYLVEIPERADVVIVSQGGAPKDLNLYQVQKALDNAGHAVKKGGTIILVGACNEGLGERTFEEWMLWAEQPSDLIKRVHENFKLGGHKAAAIAMVLENARIILVSELDNELVEKCFMVPCKSLQDALDEILVENRNAKVLVMPWGGSTLPRAER